MSLEGVRALNELVRAQAKQHTDADGDRPTADVHFFRVVATDAADRDALVTAIIAALGEGEFVTMTAARLAAGPGYIELGGWLGDQGQALLFMGLCELLEVGKVLGPATLGITGEQANDLAGRGFVMLQVTLGVLG